MHLNAGITALTDVVIDLWLFMALFHVLSLPGGNSTIFITHNSIIVETNTGFTPYTSRATLKTLNFRMMI
ncbi:hypothetical protein BJX99DRAFT_13517 [Aspergillus californicus]